MMPFVLTVAAFAVLYVTLPNCRVRWAHAATGGLVAAALLELLKQGFGEYVQAFPAYRTIYGAMSSLPLFLIWMYLVWSVILFGGVIAAAWPEWRAERAQRSSKFNTGHSAGADTENSVEPASRPARGTQRRP